MAIIKIRVRVIKLRKERLERMVKQRTLEIVEKNNEIMAQNEEIEAQNEKLAELFDELTQNIETAKRLQQSALPLSETIANFIPEHFILYRPKDIVSGDFYWFHEKFGKLYLAAIDCTGHGVSGAFMSLIGKSLLDKIIVENPTYQAGEILNELSASLVRALNQDREESFSKEGMDIALCIIDKEEEMIQFAGANNPLFIKNGNELEVIKGDAFGIGLLKGKAASGFTSHNISIKPNDIFYIFSDGYFSQFGGGSGEEKLKIARFKEVIMGLGNIPLQHHKEELEQYLEKWQRSTGQTDDILVIGFKG